MRSHGLFLDEYIFILAEVLLNMLIIIRPPANITNLRRICDRIIINTFHAGPECTWNRHLVNALPTETSVSNINSSPPSAAYIRR